jgi:hypothetical protein
MRDTLLKFHNDLLKLSPDKLTYVTLEPRTNTLSYHQVGRVVMVPYISHMFLPIKFKVGVLTESGLNDLIRNLNQLVTLPDYDKIGIMTGMDKMEIKFYRPFNLPSIYGPQLFISLRLVTITTGWLVRIMNRFTKGESRIIYKSLIKNLKTKN